MKINFLFVLTYLLSLVVTMQELILYYTCANKIPSGYFIIY